MTIGSVVHWEWLQQLQAPPRAFSLRPRWLRPSEGRLESDKSFRGRNPGSFQWSFSSRRLWRVLGPNVGAQGSLVAEKREPLQGRLAGSSANPKRDECWRMGPFPFFPLGAAA